MINPITPADLLDAASGSDIFTDAELVRVADALNLAVRDRFGAHGSDEEIDQFVIDNLAEISERAVAQGDEELDA